MRLIDADAAMKKLGGESIAKYPNTFTMGLLAAVRELKNMPTIEQPAKSPVTEMEDRLISNGVTIQKHGRWIKNGVGRLWCSECHNHIPYFLEHGGVFMPEESDFCPNCGAKMEVSHD